MNEEQIKSHKANDVLVEDKEAELERHIEKLEMMYQSLSREGKRKLNKMNKVSFADQVRMSFRNKSKK